MNLGFLENVGYIVVLALIVVVITAAKWQDTDDLRARYRAWKNRRRHPELARKYNLAEGDEKISIAQEMMGIDREHDREQHKDLPGPNYPMLGDYIQPDPTDRATALFCDFWRVMRGHGMT